MDRKRPRSTSPTPGPGGKSRAGVPSSTSLAQKLLRSPISRIEALNELLRITVSPDMNYAMDGDALLKAMARVFYEVIGWDEEREKQQKHQEEKEGENEEDEREPQFSAKHAWMQQHLSPPQAKWAQYCQTHLSKSYLSVEDLKTLDAIMTVLRNLSFVAANLRLMAYSNDIVEILAGSLYEQSSKLVGALEDNSNNATVLAQNALHILTNLTPYMDVTGQKLVCDKLFLKSATPENINDSDGVKLPDPDTFGQAADGRWGFGSVYLAKKLDTKEDFVQDVSQEMLLQLTKDYLVRVWSIFPALGKVLVDTTSPRAVTMMAVELLQEFINLARVGVVGNVEDQENSGDIPNLRAIMVHIPDNILQRLTDFLYIPRLSSDSLEYTDPIVNIVTRVTPLKLLGGYDSTVDTDIRDRSLDVLVPLLELDSPNMAKRLGTKPSNGLVNNRIFDSVVPILATKSGRNEAPLLAIQLLKELAKAEENKNGLLYVQERVIAIASKDPRVAHLALNHLYAPKEPQQ
ncbi:hypothetical protein IV203_005115 [Nitzschia inconspicua]|uniref:Uncharacterized protein n=1 Tax=Nitzschia inconspicua TaxID=303405 RepID=A0A9K3PFU1_9STRA|nr:hypothetical protein IV203_005115 [Nitzschia inconspicua]